MNFYKMNGTGNDFIVINNIEEKIPENKLGELAKHLCTRRFSIGADGLMAVCEPTRDDCDYRMLFLNADGSEGEMCGNGARCLCRYGYEKGLAKNGNPQRIETASGVVVGTRLSAREYRILMPAPEALELGIEAGKYTCDYVRVGVPHVLLRYPMLKSLVKTNTLNKIKEIAYKIRWNDTFPDGTNVNFYDYDACGSIYLLTYERGVEDFTLACGTGSTAAAYILRQKGEVKGNSLELNMRGGKLTVEEEESNLYLSGTTNIVAIGTVTDDELPG